MNRDFDWVRETVKLQALEFERQNGKAFTFLTNEVKNAMLLKHCLTPKVVSEWHPTELVFLLAECHNWYK